MYPKLPERLWRNSWLQPPGWRVCQSRQEPWAVCGSSRWGRAVWAQSGSTRFLMMGVVVVVATKEIIWQKYWGPAALARPELTRSLVVMVKVEQRKNANVQKKWWDHVKILEWSLAPNERSCFILSNQTWFALSSWNSSKNVPKPVQFAIFYLLACWREGFKL